MASPSDNLGSARKDAVLDILSQHARVVLTPLRWHLAGKQGPKNPFAIVIKAQPRQLGVLAGSGWHVHRVAADGDCQFAALYAAMLVQDKALTWIPFGARDCHLARLRVWRPVRARRTSPCLRATGLAARAL